MAPAQSPADWFKVDGITNATVEIEPETPETAGDPVEETGRQAYFSTGDWQFGDGRSVRTAALIAMCEAHSSEVGFFGKLRRVFRRNR